MTVNRVVFPLTVPVIRALPLVYLMVPVTLVPVWIRKSLHFLPEVEIYSQVPVRFNSGSGIIFVLKLAQIFSNFLLFSLSDVNLSEKFLL